MTSRRDYGRQASYRAERKAFPEWYDVRLTWDEVTATVKEIHTLHGDGKTLPRIQLSPNRDETGAVAYPGMRRIFFGGQGGSGVSIFVILHELAHIYTPVCTGHGPMWRRKYVQLVRSVLGGAEADALVAAFASEGVPVDAEKAVPIRRKGVKRRTFVTKIRRVIDVKEVKTPEGYIRADYTYADWEDAPSDLQVSTAERADMRKGFILFRSKFGTRHLTMQVCMVEKKSLQASLTTA